MEDQIVRLARFVTRGTATKRRSDEGKKEQDIRRLSRMMAVGRPYTFSEPVPGAMEALGFRCARDALDPTGLPCSFRFAGCGRFPPRRGATYQPGAKPRDFMVPRPEP